MFTEDVTARFEAFGWHVQTVEDGDTDLEGIDAAIRAAKDERSRPSLVIVKTTIGYGSEAVSGTSRAHGAPLGEEEVAATKKNLGWQPDRKFYVPEPALAHFRSSVKQGQILVEEWRARLEAFAKEYPELFEEWELAQGGQLPVEWDEDLPTFERDASIATRVAGGRVLNALARKIPQIMGGDADLGSSTKTRLEDEGDFEGVEGSGRNIHFGVREHAMGAIANGIAHHGGVRPFVATFFCFSDYMRPAVRLAALDRLPVTYVWTHDSIGVGEDGPTHQPVEHLASLRAMPGLVVIRPADANETRQAWKIAASWDEGPVALVLSRQGLPVLAETEERPGSVSKGAYVLMDPEGGDPEIILMASGAEVHVALEAGRILGQDGVRARVVSMPSFELFLDQDRAYREEILPPAVKARISIEAAATFGWERFVGDGGLCIGLNRFGASAPGQVLFEKFGFTARNVVEQARGLL